jgi:ankyrin repeat protein
MSDAVPLRPRPNLEQYRRLARDLQRACQTGEPDRIRAWMQQWLDGLTRLRPPEMSGGIQQEIRAGVERQWRTLSPPSTLTGAQFFLARCHGFASWQKFARHIQAVATANSPIAQFEQAVDAIVSGDLALLRTLLSKSPDLVRVRSTREHRSTLLHYVSANGVEDFRQTTPHNIVEIAKLLLEAGADVNAESEAYGGRSTTLMLTATSAHPAEAGVQIPLLELLIERGALIDTPGARSVVVACLHNGRGEAAQYLARRGARLDLEGAAGIGRLDLVGGYFDEGGSLKALATEQQKTDGFAWACEFGHTAVVEFLLQHGVSADLILSRGETGLHWAAYQAHVEIVELLLANGAPIDVIDRSHHGTPLGWALHGWSHSPGKARYPETVARLVRAGAKPEPAWVDSEKLRSDPETQAALRGEAP